MLLISNASISCFKSNHLSHACRFVVELFYILCIMKKMTCIIQPSIVHHDIYIFKLGNNKLMAIILKSSKYSFYFIQLLCTFIIMLSSSSSSSLLLLNHQSISFNFYALLSSSSSSLLLWSTS